MTTEEARRILAARGLPTTMMVYRGPLFLVEATRWNSALANIDPHHLTARFEVVPGWVLARPFWCSAQDRAPWMKATEPTEVEPDGVSADVRERLAMCELMW